MMISLNYISKTCKKRKYKNVKKSKNFPEKKTCALVYITFFVASCNYATQEQQNSEQNTRDRKVSLYTIYNISIKRYIITLYFNVFYIYCIDLDIYCQTATLHSAACPGNGSSFTWQGQCCIILCPVVLSHMQYSFISFIYCITHYIILSFALYNCLTHLLKAFKFDLPSKIHPIFPTH